MPFNPKNYPPNWKDRIRPDILKRDGYKCKVCGVKQRAYGYRESSGYFVECDEHMAQWAIKHGYKLITVYLSIAHTCHDSKCENYNHLFASCQKCHNNHDQPQRLKNRKFKQKNQLNVCPGRK